MSEGVMIVLLTQAFFFFGVAAGSWATRYATYPLRNKRESSESKKGIQ